MRFSRSLVSLAALAIFAAAAPADPPDQAAPTHYSRWPKVRLAGFAVGGGFTHNGFGFPGLGYAAFGYPAFGYPGLGYGAYPSGFFYDNFAAIPPAYFYQQTLGGLRIRDADPSASVYIDGGFAGAAGHLKQMRVEPGVHALRVVQGERSFERKIYVLTGKTLTVDAAFASESNPQGSRP